MRLTKRMEKVLVRMSAAPQPVPLECSCPSRDSRALVNILGTKPFCAVCAPKNTLEALIRRGLIERTREDLLQLDLGLELGHPANPTHLRLTDKGRHFAALVRLGRRHRR